jgi:hypothetical protein
MPISFFSKSHGRIPVGFFNIETDMLLMDRYFFFSTDFCAWVVDWAEAGELSHDKKMVYAIRQTKLIGNLAGAIYGFEYTGFIGEVYRLFPFPASLSGFKQKPYGSGNRAVIEKTIQPFAVRLKIPIDFSRENRTIAFGDYVFSIEVFNDIIRYVEAGGMPGWLGGRPPAYVKEMLEKLAAARW